ncbi:MAG TPA: DciA family protein [Novosphingobium sp.]|nr:DciA family protein [Novosphingobium sp.]
MERDRGKQLDKTGGAKSKAAAGLKRYERPRGGGARPIADLMPEVGRTAFRRFGFVQSSVVSRWPEIVGARHARVCSPESIRFPPGEKNDGILQLVVVAAHAPMIQHVIPEIIDRVNRFFGYNAVARVKIRQGEVKPPPASKPRATPPTLKPVPFELGESLRDVGDPELRAVLESLARSIEARADED